jgi:signal transduction histidine kinase
MQLCSTDEDLLDLDFGMGAVSDGVDTDVDEQSNPMHGLGFGLPTSRLYAEYFGGSLDAMSMFGYGSDVYLRINRLGDQAEIFETQHRDAAMRAAASGKRR